MDSKSLNIKPTITHSDFNVGVIIARFQVDELHIGHRELIDSVVNRHKMVIIFLGVPRKKGSKRNPLPFAARKHMIQTEYPDVTIIPLEDKRDDVSWSNQIDELITQPYGNQKFILYGSRDSFISHYKGKHTTCELEPNEYYSISGSSIRKDIHSEIGKTKEWRRGAIWSIMDRYPTAYPTVDVIIHRNNRSEILLGMKPNETKWRMPGGFVDPTDDSFESAARREVSEELGLMELGPMTYLTSGRVDDWRYRSDDDKIMTTVFECEYGFGTPKPGDDIFKCKWIKTSEIEPDTIVAEHYNFIKKFIEK